MIPEGSVYYLSGTEPTPHYHVVVFSSPKPSEKCYLVCYLSSSKTLADRTTEFVSGDDFFISKSCWTKYRNAKIMYEMDLKLLSCIGIASDTTVQRIKEGLRQSLSRVPREVKDLYRDWQQYALLNGQDDW